MMWLKELCDVPCCNDVIEGIVWRVMLWWHDWRNCMMCRMKALTGHISVTTSHQRTCTLLTAGFYQLHSVRDVQFCFYLRCWRHFTCRQTVSQTLLYCYLLLLYDVCVTIKNFKNLLFLLVQKVHWWFGLVVTLLVTSAKLVYIELHMKLFSLTTGANVSLNRRLQCQESHGPRRSRSSASQ